MCTHSRYICPQAVIHGSCRGRSVVFCGGASRRLAVRVELDDAGTGVGRVDPRATNLSALFEQGRGETVFYCLLQCDDAAGTSSDDGDALGRHGVRVRTRVGGPLVEGAEVEVRRGLEARSVKGGAIRMYWYRERERDKRACSTRERASGGPSSKFNSSERAGET